MISKKIFGLGMAMIFLLSMSLAAEASYFTSGLYSGGRTNDYSNFWGFDDYYTQENSYGGYDFGSSNNYADWNRQGSGSTSDLFGEGFFNRNYGNFNQDGLVDLQDSYDLKKGCATVTEHGNFDGKGADYTITKTYCDGITGNFKKSNRYYNDVDNDYGYDQYNGGLNLYDSDYDQSFSESGANDNSNEYFNAGYGYNYGESTSFGKGTRIIFY